MARSRCSSARGRRQADDGVLRPLGVLEVEENADLPGAIQLTLPIASHGPRGHGGPHGGRRRSLRPYARIAVVVNVDGGGTDACIFDGYVLSHKIHLDRGTTAATLQVWGQDASCLMNLEEDVKEWPDRPTARSPTTSSADYGFEKAAENTRRRLGSARRGPGRR